jgi:hypothetical protein
MEILTKAPVADHHEEVGYLEDAIQVEVMV